MCHLLGTGIALSGIDGRRFSFDPVDVFFSKELCEVDFPLENLESNEVFSVESPALDAGTLNVLDAGLESGASKEMILGRLLNCVRWMTVGCSPFRRATENLRSLEGHSDAGCCSSTTGGFDIAG